MPKMTSALALDPPVACEDGHALRKQLTAQNLVLAHIAQGAPLGQTLNCIITGLAEQFHGSTGAIFLIEDDGHRLFAAAAPQLPQDYLQEVQGWIGALDGRGLLASGCAGLPMTAELMLESRFWSDFVELAQQHGLHATSVVPILNEARCLLGMLVSYAYARQPAGSAQHQAMSDGATLAAIAIARHQAEQRAARAEKTQRENETRMALAIEGSGTGIWDRNIALGEIHYSAGWKALLGYTDADVTQSIPESYARIHPEDLPLVQAAMQGHFEGITPSYAVEHRIRCKDGSYKWISSRGKVISRDSEGKALRMIGTTTDISAMRALSEKLQQSVDLITCLTNEMPGMVYQYRLFADGSGCFTYVSDGIRDIYELAPEHAIADAAQVLALVHADDLPAYHAALAVSAANLTALHLEYRVILPLQGECWHSATARPRRLPDGSTLWHGAITDITERKRTEIRLNEFATTDFLTQLPNRRHFMIRMEEELARLQGGSGATAAVLMCDLDHFKLINDSHGHATGDLVLKNFAAILRDQLRKNDSVGRVGGEEFAVVLAGAGIAEASAFAQRVQKTLAEKPLVVSKANIAVTVSIGITIMLSHDADGNAALSRSDMALYRAKQGGRNRYEVVTGQDPIEEVGKT